MKKPTAHPASRPCWEANKFRKHRFLLRTDLETLARHALEDLNPTNGNVSSNRLGQ